MHARKTGALIRAAARGRRDHGGRGTPAIVDAVAAYAAELGLAFQIVDDILDVEGGDDELGKTAGQGRRRRQADLSRAVRPRRVAPARRARRWTRPLAALALRAASSRPPAATIARLGRRAHALSAPDRAWRRAALRLDSLLVERGLAASRERARALILAGQVRVDGARR